MTEESRRTIHRKLVLRISAMGILIALGAGWIVWEIEKKEIGQAVIWKTESVFKRLNNRLRDLLNTPGDIDAQAVEKRLHTLLGQREIIRFGQYVHVRIYDLDGLGVATARDMTYENIDMVNAITGGVSDAAGRPGKMPYDVFELNQVPHIRFIAALSNNLGEHAAHGETVFAVSEEIIETTRARAFKLALAAIAIVLLTTLLIYPLVITLLNRVSAMSEKLFDANMEMLKLLGSAIAKRDSDTDSHNYRVTIISLKLAARIGLSDDDIRSLIKGAFLHDVGKIGIDDDILHKPGRLTDDEFAIMKNHVPFGLDIVNKAEWLKDAGDIVGSHHEKYDGSGYGEGLAQSQIPETARIFAIADVFDALTSRRPYKEPFSFEKTMEILKLGRGSHFDPDYIDAFDAIARSVFEEYAGREDDDLKKELEGIIKKHFYDNARES